MGGVSVRDVDVSAFDAIRFYDWRGDDHRQPGWFAWYAWYLEDGFRLLGGMEEYTGLALQSLVKLAAFGQGYSAVWGLD